MKIDLRRLTLAALVLSTSVTYNAVASAQNFVGDTEADYYGALGGFVPDAADNETPMNAVQAADEQEVWIKGTPKGTAARQVAATMYIGDDASLASDASSPSDRVHRNTQFESPYRAASHQQGGSYSSPPACDTSCDSGCDAGFGAIGAAVAGRNDCWFKSELLLWFPQARNTPPLGASAAGLPVLNPNIPGSGVPFADSFGGGLTPGFRGDIGRYFADGAFGIGGRFWILADDKETDRFGGGGVGTSYGVPFFNTFNGSPFPGEDAVFVNFAPDGVAGDAVVRSSMSVLAAEIYGRALIGESRNHRFEMLGGYSHFNITDDLALRVNSIDIPIQTIFNDSFRTRNEFHGGQIGSEISLSRGRWTASSLTKVHLGNMAQRVAVDGNVTTAIFPNPPGPVVVAEPEGLFARGEIQGVRKQDVLAFAPEMNLKLGYQFRKNVNLHVGYTFIYWNNIALAGDQMDRSIYLDPADLGDSGPYRHVDIKTSGYFVQGIDLGATIEF